LPLEEYKSKFVDPIILNLDTEQRWIMSLKPRPLYPVPSEEWLGCPRRRSGHLGKEIFLYLCRESNPGNSSLYMVTTL